MVKFISYTGKYPNLCKGVLTVEIDGKEIKFGHNSEQYEYKTNSYLDEDKNNPNYEAFWVSGGTIKTKKYNMYATEGSWLLNDNPSTYEKYPQYIKDILSYLITIFNENVEFGCCGGCI